MGFKCATCSFGKIVGADLTKRLCHGAPPTAIQAPGPKGQITLRMFRPIVSVTDDACGQYKSKDAVDNARDDEALKTIKAAQGFEMTMGGETSPVPEVKN